MAKRIVWTDQAKTDIRGIEQPIANAGPLRPDRLRAQAHRVFFRDKGDYLEVSRVLDRKEAYR